MKITDLTDQLIASYASVGGINHLDGSNLPSRTGIVGITTDLLRLLFPGFFDDKVTHSSEIKMETALLMDSVAGRLEDEILKSIEARPPDDAAKANPRGAARKFRRRRSAPSIDWCHHHRRDPHFWRARRGSGHDAGRASHYLFGERAD